MFCSVSTRQSELVYIVMHQCIFPCLHLQNRKKKDCFCSCSGVGTVMAIFFKFSFFTLCIVVAAACLILF